LTTRRGRPAAGQHTRARPSPAAAQPPAPRAPHQTGTGKFRGYLTPPTPIDSFAFRNKPVAFVAYSGGVAGGVRAIEHLAHVFVETESVPMRNSVVIPFVTNAFDEQGKPVSPMTNVAADVMLDDLAWWSAALEKARAAGELVPGSFRMRAATTAAK
jgi:hypothetical protein